MNSDSLNALLRGMTYVVTYGFSDYYAGRLYNSAIDVATSLRPGIVTMQAKLGERHIATIRIRQPEGISDQDWLRAVDAKFKEQIAIGALLLEARRDVEEKLDALGKDRSR